ncbi:PREDICTED: condensin-2 complex subunit G2 [Nanorana parkeri]|uniref:condensin-2 complex subunit G2 n=1 Tax=Nanorana parkeri TaxID=125878 RepID=UPI0008543F88|nr:PREDICTED: condensin-2 complex subunit G2 [Nanorana parkeri]
MSKREAFLQATGKETLQDFLHFIQLHKDASDPFELEEILQELPRKQKEELWQKLKALLMDTLLANPVESWHKLDDDSDDDMEVEGSSEVKTTMEVIHGVTIVSTVSVSVVEENMSYRALLECAGLLSGILEALPSSESHVRLAIQRLCEAWWEKGLEKKEEFGKIAFSMVLAKSLEPKGLAADITRLWHLHPALLSFDYNSEDSNEVRDLLLQSFMSINHIKKEEGRRFLSFIFSWDINFIKIIHGTIKNQLQSLPKSFICHIADIYLRAWKKTSEDLATTIEDVCIQDFMHHGVHLPRNSPVHPRVREILSHFHQQKLRQGVEAMLCRLYQPIIWRGLKAPNSEVRSNAALLFVEVFPLRNPNMNHADMDSEIQKQLEQLFNLLEDPHPLVRSTGVLGVCKIAAKYWEMIPPAILADLMKKILSDLAGDISSADVRASVFKSLTILLENKLSHPLLEQMLPSLKYSLHDNSEKVRVAFVDMLLKIKAARAAKFWKICHMEHLLARLEVDSRPVCRRIVNVMFNSFFPVNEPEEVWCERCVTLIQMNPGAARRFYQYAYEHTAPTNIAKLMLNIRRCLNDCLQRNICSENEENEEDNENDGNNKKNKSVLENVLSKEDTTSMASLLEIVVIMWRSIRKALDHNVEAKNYTISKFASVLPEYFRVFKDDRCTVPLIILASFMPPSAIPTFSCSVLSKLRNLNNEAEENKYSSLIDCLCRWGQVGHLLELITDWLSEALPEKKKKKDSTRKVRIQDTMECKPDLAFKYIEYLLTKSMNRDCLLAAQTNKLNNLFKQLELVKEVLWSFMKPSEGVTPILSQETSLRAFSLYCRLSIHLQNKFSSEGRTYLSMLEDTGGWIESQILGILGSSEPLTEQQGKMAQLILQTYLTVCKDVIMVGLGDSDFQAQILQILLSIIQIEECCDCLPTFLSVLKEVTEVCLAHKINNANAELDKHLDAIQTCFHKAIEVSARRLRKEQDEAFQLLHSIQVPIGQFVNTVQCWHMASSEVHHGTLSTIIAAVVVEISHALRKISDPDEIAIPTSVSELPPLSRCLMSVVIKTSSVLNAFLGDLATCVLAEEIEGILSLTASLHIIMVSSKGKRLSAVSKDIAATVYRKLKNHREVTMEDDENIERAIYESSMRTLDQLLQP